MMAIHHIVETFLAYDRPTQTVSEEWVRFRHDFFIRYTYQSLKNQEYGPFKIFLQTGFRHRELFDSLEWPADVTVCRMNGMMAYQSLDIAPGDLLVITRIDSDDMYHKKALGDVAANIKEAWRMTPEAKYSRGVMTFKTRMVWDLVNGYLIYDHKRPSSPFFTHVFNAGIVKNWTQFENRHFLAHGSGGAGDRDGVTLPRNRVCVTKHGFNHSYLKRGKTWRKFNTEADYRRADALYEAAYPGMKFTRNVNKMKAILADFGVKLGE